MAHQPTLCVAKALKKSWAEALLDHGLDSTHSLQYPIETVSAGTWCIVLHMETDPHFLFFKSLWQTKHVILK